MKPASKSRMKDIIAIILLFLASYISLALHKNSSAYLLGFLFLIAGIFGFISAYKHRRFIF